MLLWVCFHEPSWQPALVRCTCMSQVNVKFFLLNAQNFTCVIELYTSLLSSLFLSSSVLCIGAQLVVSTDFGVLHRLGWDGRFDSSLLIHLHRVPFANDLLPESRGTCIYYTTDKFCWTKISPQSSYLRIKERISFHWCHRGQHKFFYKRERERERS